MFDETWHSTPPFSFWRAKKRTGGGAVQEKKRLARNLRRAQVRLQYGGCSSELPPKPESSAGARRTFSTNQPSPRLYPWRVNAGGRRKACPPGPADATPALPGERQRKSAQRVSGRSKTHAPSTPRAATFLKPAKQSHRDTFFLFHRARRIFFLMSQKEMGGAFRAWGEPPQKWPYAFAK